MKKSIELVRADVKRYYQNLKAVKGQYKRLESLEKRLDNIREDINSPSFDHSFKTDLKGMSYDSIIVSGGSLPSSYMDREIEHIYQELERECKNTESEILRTKALIRTLENENGKMDFYINLLNSEQKRALELKHDKGHSQVQMSFELNISTSSVSRLLKKAYEDIAEFGYDISEENSFNGCSAGL